MSADVNCLSDLGASEVYLHRQCAQLANGCSIDADEFFLFCLVAGSRSASSRPMSRSQLSPAMVACAPVSGVAREQPSVSLVFRFMSSTLVCGVLHLPTATSPKRRRARSGIDSVGRLHACQLQACWGCLVGTCVRSGPSSGSLSTACPWPDIGRRGGRVRSSCIRTRMEVELCRDSGCGVGSSGNSTGAGRDPLQGARVSQIVPCPARPC